MCNFKGSCLKTGALHFLLKIADVMPFDSYNKKVFRICVKIIVDFCLGGEYGS